MSTWKKGHLERLVTNHDHDREVHFWDAVKTDRDVRIMINESPNIVLMIVIS